VFRAREGVITRENETPLHLAFGVRVGGLSPEKENPLHLAFGVREGVVTRGGVAREREPHSILCLEQWKGLLPEETETDSILHLE